MPLNNVRVNCILLIIPATLILPKIFFFFNISCFVCTSGGIYSTIISELSSSLFMSVLLLVAACARVGFQCMKYLQLTLINHHWVFLI